MADEVKRELALLQAHAGLNDDEVEWKLAAHETEDPYGLAKGQRTADHPVDGLLVEGGTVYFFVHRGVPDIAPGPSRLARVAVSLESLGTHTKAHLPRYCAYLKDRNARPSFGVLSRPDRFSPSPKHVTTQSR